MGGKSDEKGIVGNVVCVTFMSPFCPYPRLINDVICCIFAHSRQKLNNHRTQRQDHSYVFSMLFDNVLCTCFYCSHLQSKEVVGLLEKEKSSKILRNTQQHKAKLEIVTFLAHTANSHRSQQGSRARTPRCILSAFPLTQISRFRRVFCDLKHICHYQSTFGSTEPQSHLTS